MREVDPKRLCPPEYSTNIFEPATRSQIFIIHADPTIDKQDLKVFVESWYLSELEARWNKDTLFAGRSPEPKREPNGDLGVWGWQKRYD